MRDFNTLAPAVMAKLYDNDEHGGRWKGLELLGPDSMTMPLVVIASWGLGWDHVSVSIVPLLHTPLKDRRPPDWNAMEAVRRAFFFDHETVVQISPPRAKYVNRHPGVLHLWRKQDAEHPLPDELLI